MSKPPQIYVGFKYESSLLTVVRVTVGDVYVDCVCDCGAIVTRKRDNVFNGNTKSCGCLKRDHPVRLRHGCSVKGASGFRTYKAWLHMRARCFDENEANYPNYGGRGITVCKRWLKFDNFLTDMGECPPGYSIERVDANENYTPKNCKWIPFYQQAHNRRNTQWITAEGKKQRLMVWARELGVSDWFLRDRLHKGESGEAIVRSARLFRNEKAANA